MKAFYPELTSLISRELSEIMKSGDADRAGAMIEGLARGLGFAIAVVTKGNGQAIDRMISGAEAYAHSEAVSRSKFAAVFEQLKRTPSP